MFQPIDLHQQRTYIYVYIPLPLSSFRAHNLSLFLMLASLVISSLVKLLPLLDSASSESVVIALLPTSRLDDCLEGDKFFRDVVSLIISLPTACLFDTFSWLLSDLVLLLVEHAGDDTSFPNTQANHNTTQGYHKLESATINSHTHTYFINTFCNHIMRIF